MKKRIKGFLLLLLALITQFTFAQDMTISGIVSDSNGLPIPGVNVKVKGTSTGTSTDFDGSYKIKAKTTDVLVFSFQGMNTQELKVSGTKMNARLATNATELEGLIVTALGVKKEKKKVGFAISEIKETLIEQREDSDIARVLTGKASGVNIIAQNGVSGSGTNVIIRGLKSFSGSNQALFIVDGTPFSSDTNASGRQGDRNDFVNGNNGSSRFLDLDPNNIESVSILKGLAASTLYGTLGRNGVILITTKSGSSKRGLNKNSVSVSTSLFINELASLPDYQNKYGNGFDQGPGWFFSNWGPAFEKGGAAGYGNYTTGSNPFFDANGTTKHPYSISNFASDFPQYAGARYDYKPYNSVQKFFRKGLITNTSINFKGQSDDAKTNFNVNYSRNDDAGFTPGNGLKRNTIAIGGNTKINDKLLVSGTLNFANTKFTSPPVALSLGNGATGTGNSIFGDIFFTPRSVDIQGLPYQNPRDGSSTYYRSNNSIQHPTWTVENSGTSQNTNRVFGNLSLSYDLTNNFNFTYRAGLDNYNEANENFQNKGGVNQLGDARTTSGFYETWNNVNNIWDHLITFNGKYKLSDKLIFNFTLGGTSRSEVYSRNGVASDGQQIFDVFRHYNFKNSLPIESFAERNIAGIFGQADFEYGSYLFLNLSARKDWVSDFALKNQSITYPSASLSFVPTSAFEAISSEKGLNYLKLRAGIGTSANFGDFGTYPTSDRILLNVRDSQTDSGTNIITNSVSTRLGNPDLKPELLSEYEFGLETKFYKNRFGIEFSIFNRVTKDLIVDRPLDPSTFYSVTKTNIGEIKGSGIELDFNASVIKSKTNGLEWDVNMNYTQNRSEVTDLGLDTKKVIYSGFSNLGNVAQVGSPLTAMFGSRVLRDGAGNLVVGSDGRYKQDPIDGIIGDSNPDYILNVSNTFKYKNFELGFLINYRKGGDVYSSTVSTLLGRGLIVETLDRERTFILPGVNEAGQVNTKQLNNSEFYFNNLLFGPNELQVYDASTIRLQELSFGYSVPSKFLSKTFFKGVSFKASGNNLYFNAINIPKGANFDPNSSGTGVGNGSGFEFLNGPSSRRYGFSVKLLF